MVQVSINGGKVVLEVEGWDKLWAFKSRLEIPVAHIRDVNANPSLATSWWKGIRALGTHLPGVITAGTFYQDGNWIFWDVHHPDKTIVIDLIDERYNKLIVEVENPDTAVGLIRDAMAARR